MSLAKTLDEETGDYLKKTLQSQMNNAATPTVSDLLEWTIKHRLLNGHAVQLPPCQIALYEDMAPDVVIMKGTQIFISEFLVNLALWALDTKYADRGNVLYSMPTQVLADDFSQSRVDKAIEESPYLQGRFSRFGKERFGNNIAAKYRMDKKDVNRARLKMLGTSALHLRGADSLKQMTTIDADIVINDEVDFFSGEAIKWFKERLGSSQQPLYRAVSKPTYPGIGIHSLYQDSDQREWHIKCEACNRWQYLIWEKNVVYSIENGQAVDVQVLCSDEDCRNPLDRLGPGEWIAAFPSRRIHGYHISRLLSPYVNLVAMAEESIKVTDIEAVQSFHNSGLGLPYAPKGGRLDVAEMQFNDDLDMKPAVAGYGGVDVGLKLHAAIIEKIDGIGKVVRQAEEFDEFEELDNWFKKNNVRTCIIDARGDPRSTLDWAARHPGRVYRWLHIETPGDTRYVEETQEVKINRTTLLDRMYSSCREGGTVFAAEIKTVPDFVAHLRALVRELIKDPRLNRLVPRYIGSAPDHYAFAMAFANLAAGDDIDTPAPTVVSKEATPGHNTGASWTGHNAGKGWRNVG